MRRQRISGLLAVFLALSLALAPGLAEAKAGRGSSMGSRGARTYQPNGARPIERSITPPPASQPAPPMASPMAPQAQPRLDMPPSRPGFFQRNPFLGGLLVGGLGAMLFGGHMFGYGVGGFLGFAVQIILLVLLARWVIGLIRRRAGGGLGGAVPFAMPGAAAPGMATSMGGQPRPAPAGGRGVQEFPLGPDDLGQFERHLADIQAAWSRGDMAAMRQLATPEIAVFMEEQLLRDQARGVRNIVEQVRLTKGDVVETWQEGATQYATVSLSWSAVDYSVRLDNGQVVEGDPQRAGQSSETWTFLRQPGAPWRLTAIQQV